MKEVKPPKLKFWTVVFWIILALGIYVTIVRFTKGLGAVTNLSDNFPWGLWIGFDVLCGVGLAAGGFVMASAVYIFNLEDYKSILPSAILTAFLGYILVIVALIYDLGKPWNIWHPIIMWNPESVMFEVAWCVMLYTTVLALEFSPMLFQKLRLVKPKKIIHNLTIPLVVAGVILSTLHQSSLGSLYLIVPEKLHPIWYSSNLPYLFFLSAVAVGPAMVTIESYLSSRAFKREIEIHILSRLGKVSAVALMVYFVLKVEDIVNYKLFKYIFAFNYESVMFWLEFLLGVILPIVLLANSKVRESKKWLFYAQLTTVLGFILNRLNVSITALESYTQARYFPKWTEIVITMFMVSLGFAAFRFIAKTLPVFPEEVKEKERFEGYFVIPIKEVFKE
ncbi:Ni/Fe-hydrogenase 2 integral membrane subunit HybB [Candidatus Thermokryptus mobilis]|uniref:Ni/Fe-hydrogenase 2 integral membrane subunit HybB n=1 Tax=Candidatus Thermokryptus mobilis TaxID=1643428 RepID=A0A0S4MXE7_9BACT|nr:Ni/Fe-hydrogenase cytochrome b subunit [Candidatus Thermokryptus mobilis]CUU02545.1 Ni/Fe-hydrogenase 2 integral membrane subunit HybB [Candidatus Thermokryptus mobilis]